MKRSISVILSLLCVAAMLLPTAIPVLADTGYTAGATQAGATTTAEAAEEEAQLYVDAVSASVAGDINLHLYANFSAELRSAATEFGLLIFPTAQASYEYKSAYAYKNGTEIGNGQYIYTYAGIAAKKMTDVLYVVPYCKTADGYVYGEVREASVRAYAEALRSAYRDSATKHGAALYKLACTMLNYGAEAQKYFKYKTDNLANAKLTVAEQTITVENAYEDVTLISGTATLSGYGFYGAALILADLPDLRVFLKTDAGLSMSGITVQVSEDPNFSSYATYTPTWYSSSSRYGITVSGVPASRMRTTLYFRIVSGTSYSATLTYSPASYAKRSHDKGYDSVDVTDALFAYADAAVAYATLAGAQLPDGVIQMPAADLVSAIRNGSVTANGVYYVKDASMVFDSNDANDTYDAKNITVYTKYPLSLSNADGMTLKNLNLISTNAGQAAVKVTGDTDGAVLDTVSVGGGAAVGVQVDATVNQLFLKSTNVEGAISTGISLASGATEVYITGATLDVTGAGIADASGAYIKGNTILSDMDGVVLSSTGTELRNNTIDALSAAVRTAGALDALVAENTVENGTIVCENSDNTVIIKNNAPALKATGNIHLYVIENTLSGNLTLTGNNYLVADLNTEDEVLATGNTNHNGDDVTDVNYRPEVGADESLLPHVDKEQFVGRDRKTSIRLGDGNYQAFNSYILAHAQTDDYMIIAPGAYAVTDGMGFYSQHSNTTIYAYGVYMERQENLYSMLNIIGAENLTFKGLAIGFKQQSCGQVYVLEKLANNQVRVVTGAGMMNDFGASNTGYFLTDSVGAQRAGTFYAYCDTWIDYNAGISKDNSTAAPTMIMTLGEAVYNMTQVGDLFTCRAANGNNSINIGDDSKDVVFYDFTFYGNAGGFAFMEYNTLSGTTYYRVYDTTRSGEIIDAATYNAYLALESQYGVDLEIEIDDEGRYRGSLPHIGSIDATHSSKCAEGSQATFCVFENMCDDATNQGHWSSRLHSVVDNGDGTTTITYKPALTENAVRNGSYEPTAVCYDFKTGDRVYIYTANGQLICDTSALSNVSYSGVINNPYGYNANYNMQLRSVKILSSAISDKAREALNQYDLSLNTVDNEFKVLVDNMSRASNGFKFDNCKFQNIRSRGLLIKASEGRILNCTFRNIGCACVAVQYEIFWGEAGVTENMLIDRNLFDNTGYFAPSNYTNDTQYAKDMDAYSVISIQGLGSSVDEDFLLYNNITISNNYILNRACKYAVYVNSAKDVTIVNNYFGEFNGNDFTKKPEAAESAENPVPTVHINGAMNIEISENHFPNTSSVTDKIVVSQGLNIFGTDLGLTSGAEDGLIKDDLVDLVGEKEFELPTESTATQVLGNPLYSEMWRPAYHYTTEESWINDPNGLTYFNGQYHIYYQLNPDLPNHGNLHWGHATSTDLLHFTEEEPVLFPDADGLMFSGTSYVDSENRSGLFNGVEGGGLIVAYSTNNQEIGIAYSADGYHFEKLGIVIETPADTTDFRDPKLFYDEVSGKWTIITAYQVRFFQSDDLHTWEQVSFNYLYGECPDFFPMTVEGTNTEKWVLTLGGREAYVGTWDGTTFTPEASAVLNYGHDSYAGIIFSADKNDRIMMMNWMDSWYYHFPTEPDGRWSGAMTLINELKLVQNGNGYRITQTPVEEYEALHGDTLFSADSYTYNGTSPFDAVNSQTYLLEFTLDATSGKSFAIRLYDSAEEYVLLSYDAATKTFTLDRSRSVLGIDLMKGAVLPEDGKNLAIQTMTIADADITNGKIDVQVYVDTSSVEVYACNSIYVLTSRTQPLTSSRGLTLTGDSGLALTDVKVTQLGNIHFEDATAVDAIHTETEIEVRVLGTNTWNNYFRVIKTARVGAGDAEPTFYRVMSLQPGKAIKAKSLDPTIATVEVTEGGLLIYGVKAGKALIQVSVDNTYIHIPVEVHAGGQIINSFSATSGTVSTEADGSIVLTQNSGDGFAMSSATVSDFTYSADVTINGSTMAAALLFRVSDDNNSFYAATLDASTNVVKVWSPGQGELQVVQLDVQNDTTYNLKVVASGSIIQVYVDDVLKISLSNSALSSGKLGINVYNGSAQFDNVVYNVVE